MTKPEMILFDYGGTLMYESYFDSRKGNEALFRFVKDDPQNVGVDEFTDYLRKLFDEIRALRGERIEIHEAHFMRYVLEHFGMTLSVPFEYAEVEIADAITHAEMTPRADDMLAFLRGKGIRTGVISNLCWSGNVLGRRLALAFPEHRFEFVMSSSEYVFRKPDPHIFDLAVRKSGLPRERIWYCGNDVRADIIGARDAGLFPVFYDNRTLPHFEKLENDDIPIDFPCLRISSWEELMNALSDESNV